MRRSLKGQSGANAVEFALILPILIVLIFGIFFGGIAYNRQLALTQAAREGARFAATLPVAPGASIPDEAWFTLVRERIEQSSTGALVPGQADRYICIRFVGETNADTQVREIGTGSCTVDSSSVEDLARVEVVVGRPAVLEFIFYSFPVNLRADSIARFEGLLG